MGGLTITLHFIAPNIIKIIRKIYNKCKSNTKITSVPAPFWYHNKILKLYVLYKYSKWLKDPQAMYNKS